MATPTYTLIEEQVLGSAQASVTFGSGGTLTQAYKDLVIEILLTGTSAAGHLIGGRFNADSGTNYSGTGIAGNGTTAGSYRYSNISVAPFGAYNYGEQAGIATNYVNIQSYANTQVYKTFVTRYSESGYMVDAGVGLWRSTSAITSIEIRLNGTATFSTNSTFRLWGIA